MSIYDDHVAYAPPEIREQRLLDILQPNLPPSRQIDPLSDIAMIMRRLTYGQMVELADGLGVKPDILHNWSRVR